MPSFEYDIGEKERVGSRFVSEVNDELQRVLLTEKKERKFTQQSVADKLEVNRSVVNRRFMGLENLTAKTIAETLWALGWAAHFEARKLDAEEGENEFGKSPTNVFKFTLPPMDARPVSKTASTGLSVHLEIA